MRLNLLNRFFVLTLFIFGILSFYKFDLMPNFSENRQLNKFPTELGVNFPKEFSGYISDNFGFRKPLLALFFRIKINFLRSDLGLPITLGDEEWIFIREEILFHQKKVNPGPVLLKKISQNLDSWCSYSKKNGAKFYFLIGPNKSTIYPEKMNSKFTVSENETFIDILKNQVYKCNFEIIDVRELLTNNKKLNLYYKWGTHWNDMAGFLVWNKIKSDIKLNQQNIVWPKPNKTEVILRPARPLEDSVWAWFGGSDPWVELIPEVRYVNSSQSKISPKNNDIRLFAIGDSFLEFMFNSAKVVFPNYLAFNSDTQSIVYENLDKNTYAWLEKAYGKNLNLDAITVYKPNVVILESVERNLHSLADLPAPRDY